LITQPVQENDIELEYHFKRADGSFTWVGMVTTKGSEEDWRQVMSSTPERPEIGVFISEEEKPTSPAAVKWVAAPRRLGTSRVGIPDTSNTVDPTRRLQADTLANTVERDEENQTSSLRTIRHSWASIAAANQRKWGGY